MNGKFVYAHRVAYEEAYGPISDGMEVDHLCHNRSCINPDHLEAVPRGENRKRSLARYSNHCKHGHEFTPENTYTHRDGRRVCRACRRAAYREKVSAAIQPSPPARSSAVSVIQWVDDFEP